MLLNKAAVEKFIWSKLESERPVLYDKFNAISHDTYETLDAFVRAKIIEEIKKHTTIGKTFKIGL